MESLKASSRETTPPQEEVQNIRRICYMCKTNFSPENPEDEAEEEKPENIDELPTTIAKLKPMAKRGIGDLSTHFGTDLMRKLDTIQTGSVPLEQAFCKPCFRHLAHIGALSEDLEMIRRTRLRKMIGLGQLMAITRKKRKHTSNPTKTPTPPKKNCPAPATRPCPLSRRTVAVVDIESDSSLEGDNSIWSSFRNHVVKCHSDTEIDAILNQPKTSESPTSDYSELNLIPSSESETSEAEAEEEGEEEEEEENEKENLELDDISSNDSQFGDEENQDPEEDLDPTNSA